MKGIKYTAHEKEKALKMWLVDKVDIFLVAKRTKCTIQSLYRWRIRRLGRKFTKQIKPPAYSTPERTHTRRNGTNCRSIQITPRY